MKKGVLSSTIGAAERLKGVFSDVKEELEDHLTAINENTNEISANYEYLCEIDSKMDKLNERPSFEQIPFPIKK